MGVIPARYGSSRLPGKPLVDLQGKPLLYHVYQRSLKARTLDRLLIATDDERVYRAASEFGAPVVMTKKEHRSGTDRIAEAVQDMDADLVINIQGDEPLIDSEAIDQVVNLLEEDSASVMSTLKAPIENREDLLNTNVVKVVTDEKGYALYFSRSPVPYRRDQGIDVARSAVPLGYRHIGLYVYRRDFLFTFTQLPRTPLEQTEQLEQLRALEWGYRITVSETARPTIEIDTPEDLRRAEEAMP